MLIALERVAAHEFGETVRLMGIRRPNRTHLAKPDAKTPLRELPRGLSPGKTSTDDADTVHSPPLGRALWAARIRTMQVLF